MLSLQPRADVAPTLVIAIGNPSRGDDALGPLAGQRLAAMRLRDVEVLTEFQLQVEHALDLLGRRRVVWWCLMIGVPRWCSPVGTPMVMACWIRLSRGCIRVRCRWVLMWRVRWIRW